MWPKPVSQWRKLSRQVQRKSRSRRPLLEALEDRTLPSAYMVTTTAESGPGSLSDAISQVNADTSHTLYPSPSNPGADEIDFNITAASDTGGGYNSATGVATILVRSGLPYLQASGIIDGYTQPGAQVNTLAQGDNAVLKIVLDGSQAYSHVVQGLILGSGNTIRGLDINSFPSDGIGIIGDDNVIEGNFIGTDVTGEHAQGNAWALGGEEGVRLGGLPTGGTSSHNRIGTYGNGQGDFADRNIISANGAGASEPINVGVTYYASYNVVAGNYIGTDASGTQSLTNYGYGLVLYGGPYPTSNNQIGGNGPSDLVDGNVISGNPFDGIVVGATSNDTIYGNSIGTDVTGTTNLGNGHNGIVVIAGTHNVAISGNVIAYNGEYGVGVSQDTTGGWNPNFGPTSGVQIEGNSIHDNRVLGIGLGGTWDWPASISAPFRLDTPLPGVLQNDSQGHAGPNHNQDYPVLTSAVSSSTDTSLTGTFTEAAEPNTAITLDFYANPSPDPSGHGQGQSYLGQTTVTTDAIGSVTFTADLAAGSLAGQWLTATATDPNGNTSEFALDVQATAAPSQSYAQYLQAALPQNSTTANSMTIQASASVTLATVIQAVNGLTGVTQPVTVILDLGGSTYSTGGVAANPPPNVTLVIENGTLDPAYPALSVAGGQVFVLHCTLTTSGDTPTLLITGGSVTLRHDTITQTSTNFTDPAISISGGTLDLGTTSEPGGNTLNVNGAGTFIQNTTSNPIAIVGDTFTQNGVPLGSLSGLVFEDFNDDGQVDFGEPGISGVTIRLSGTDDLGVSVNLSQTTDADGAYAFLYLRPGHYYLSETQPAGYSQGIDSVGTAGGSLTATDLFFVQLGAGIDGINYNYGERPPAGAAVQAGQTAGIGFWHNNNGQALIRALNGGSSTQLADWLATTLPHMYGSQAGSHSLIHSNGSYFSNTEVAAFYQSLFNQSGPKLDAQVLATALSVYVTNATLDPTLAAASYGFTVSGDGAGTATVNVGSNGDAFGVANNSTMPLMDLMLATDAQAVNGVLYNGNTLKRNHADTVYSAVNQAGDIG
jgi:hypothetical protein